MGAGAFGDPDAPPESAVGRNIDLWLVWVYQNFGGPVLLATLALPLLLLLVALVLLRGPIPGPRPGLATEDLQWPQANLGVRRFLHMDHARFPNRPEGSR